uniref:Uncharacterized protein n=1 Tax=Ditylenchus dipsaci TaxID=166011 RepID=A0A915EN04_9BILA
MVFVKASGQISQLSTYASSPQYCSRVWHHTLWLCLVFTLCILLLELPECSSAPTFAQEGLARNHNGFFDSIDKEVVLGMKVAN